MKTDQTDDLAFLGGGTAVTAGAPVVSPPPAAEPLPAEKPRAFMVRLPAHLHAELQALAVETSLSMNEFVICAVEDLVRESRGREPAETGAVVLARRGERRKVK